MRLLWDHGKGVSLVVIGAFLLPCIPYSMSEMSSSYDTNPENLNKREILNLIKVCPVCDTPWPKDRGQCANNECGVKVRVEPKALNWWMFYPKQNGWGHLVEDDLDE
ncbi:MAG: hypothetical protein JW779_11370 [Candidatus Thorarchaeota archaeon]|nr:hypothetical protein [Candidatus Thorarchaeota archaeon]